MTRFLRLLSAASVIAATFSGAALARDMIESRESIYNNIYVYKEDTRFYLTFGHNKRYYTESIYDSADELALPVNYTRFMTVGLAYVDNATEFLEIGFGGGRTAWYLHKSIEPANITSVELDPDVYELAVKYFGVQAEPGFDIAIDDGRKYMIVNDRDWDVIMLDAYRGPFVPFHLLTREFYEVVKERLTEGGVVVQNVEPTTMVFDAALITIKDVFENVEVFDAGGNVVMVAYDGPVRKHDELMTRAAALTDQYKLKYPLTDMLNERRLVTKLPETDVLTDDFAPVESLLAIDNHNRKWEAFSEKPQQ
jgi:spermidine synthase